MNYGEVKADFSAKFKRRDVTAAQVESFIKHGIQRTQRLLRSPASETTALETVEEGFEKQAIPGDYLKLISLSVDGIELTKTNLNTANRLAENPGTPRFFCRNGAYWIIGPLPEADAEIEIVYHADFSALSLDEDTNWLTEIAPDVIVTGALAHACMHFNDNRMAMFEDTFVKAVSDINLQALDDELTNAAVEPAYSLNFYDEEGL